MNLLIAISLLYFVHNDAAAGGIKTILPASSAISSPKAGEIARHPAHGPVLFHEGKWQSFSNPNASKYPDYSISSTAVKLTPDTYATLRDQETVCSTNSLETANPVSISVITGDSNSNATAGWNYLYYVLKLDGKCHLVVSSSATQPTGATSDITSNSRYRYIGAIHLTGTSGSFVGTPLVKDRNRYSYEISEDTSGDTSYGSAPGYAPRGHEFAFPPAKARILTISGRIESESVGGNWRGVVYNMWSYGWGLPVGTSMKGNIVAVKTPASGVYADFESIDISSAPSAPNYFNISYKGILTLKLVGHVEDPILFSY